MGINYAQVSGNRQALLDATLTKRMQPAFAARSALWAVALAMRGMTGPRRALEGDAGYFGLYVNGPAPEADVLTAERDAFEIERVAVKRFPSCGACHNAQIAAERLSAEEDPAPEHIDRVELFGFGAGNIVSQPFIVGENPQVSAQFSVAWAVAHTLLRGPAKLVDYTDDSVRNDTDVTALAQAVTFVDPPDDVDPAPEAPADYPPYSDRPQGVIVHMTDGRRLLRTQYPAATFAPGNASFEQVVAKFHDGVAFSGACDAERIDAIIEAVRTLDEAPDAGMLVGLMAAPGLAGPGRKV
jgi:2-methylcitrate dehydratase PrpD